MKKLNIVIFLICSSTLMSCIFVQGDPHTKADLVTLDTLPAYAARDSIPLSNAFLKDTSQKEVLHRDALVEKFLAPKAINTHNIRPQEVINFAKTMIGTPYRYGSTDPKVGFDCSGFFTYVFTHFRIMVPRSSIDFTEAGRDIPIRSAQPGDLLLFTGTDSTERFVGHMGMVVSHDNGELQFIHSTSGKQYGVTITPFSNYYNSRYLKTIRIFPDQR